MPENDLPSTKPNPDAAPGEFDFAAPVTERPRVKRRALEQATPAKPVEAEPAKAEVRPSTNTTTSTAATTRPASTPNTPYQPSSTAAKAKAASTQPASPHGTRPATLYYSSGTRQDKSTTSTPPMKTTPSASPAPTTAAAAPTTAARTAPAAASTSRPSSAIDYRTNVDRQAREQKSVGGILTILVYSLIFLFVSGACLATYGMYVITKQLNQQSVTMTDFDQRYSADYKDINGRLVITMDNLTQAQATIAKQQEIITKQQEAISKLLATADDTAAALRQERATRAQETANIRSRLKDLEYTGSGTTTRKY